MSDYQISPVYPGDKRTLAQVEALLEQEGIRLDPHLDYTCVMFDENYKAIATGSCFGNTLRCMAVSSERTGLHPSLPLYEMQLRQILPGHGLP